MYVRRYFCMYYYVPSRGQQYGVAAAVTRLGFVDAVNTNLAILAPPASFQFCGLCNRILSLSTLRAVIKELQRPVPESRHITYRVKTPPFVPLIPSRTRST